MQLERCHDCFENVGYQTEPKSWFTDVDNNGQKEYKYDIVR